MNSSFCRLTLCIIALFLSFLVDTAGAFAEMKSPLLLVRVPAGNLNLPAERSIFPSSSRCVPGCSIIRWDPAGPGDKVLSLTGEFYAACDPAVSFDGGQVLFSGKRTKNDSWQIWSMDPSGGNKKQITRGQGDSFSPLHVGTLFYLNDKTPIPQITFVGSRGAKGAGKEPTLALYAANPDGTNVRQITFNRASDFDTDVLPNGRILFSSQKPEKASGTALLAINIDGTDLAAYGEKNRRFKEAARVDRAGKRVYYIESTMAPWPGGGDLAFISTKRPLHTMRLLSPAKNGVFLSPCPLPGGGLLAAFRPKEEGSVFALHLIDPATGKNMGKRLGEPGFHLLDPQVLAPRKEVRGRSSIVGFRHKDTGVFFSMSCYISDLPGMKNAAKGTLARLRVIEGASSEEYAEGTAPSGERTLGEAPVEADGSFHIRVPSQTPLRFQLLDKGGRTMAEQRTWTWVMPGESRGCIGCHEDPEMVPPNRLTEAIVKPEVKLLKP